MSDKKPFTWSDEMILEQINKADEKTFSEEKKDVLELAKTMILFNMMKDLKVIRQELEHLSFLKENF